MVGSTNHKQGLLKTKKKTKPGKEVGNFISLASNMGE